jgi:hypothetical protein
MEAFADEQLSLLLLAAEGARSGQAVEYLKGMVSAGDATALAAG